MPGGRYPPPGSCDLRQADQYCGTSHDDELQRPCGFPGGGTLEDSGMAISQAGGGGWYIVRSAPFGSVLRVGHPQFFGRHNSQRGSTSVHKDFLQVGILTHVAASRRTTPLPPHWGRLGAAQSQSVPVTAGGRTRSRCGCRCGGAGGAAGTAGGSRDSRPRTPRAGPPGAGHPGRKGGTKPSGQAPSQEVGFSQIGEYGGGKPTPGVGPAGKDNTRGQFLWMGAALTSTPKPFKFGI